jgi:hypothetical protein
MAGGMRRCSLWRERLYCEKTAQHVYAVGFQQPAKIKRLNKKCSPTLVRALGRTCKFLIGLAGLTSSARSHRRRVPLKPFRHPAAIFHATPFAATPFTTLLQTPPALSMISCKMLKLSKKEIGAARVAALRAM